jgi:hypothetical protein
MGQLLPEINNPDVGIFVIWEPVLPTDFVAPSTAALARIPDARAAQYWDRKGTLWQDVPPKSVYSINPVGDVICGAKEFIQRLLQAAQPQGEVKNDERTSWFVPGMGECSATGERVSFAEGHKVSRARAGIRCLRVPLEFLFSPSVFLYLSRVSFPAYWASC